MGIVQSVINFGLAKVVETVRVQCVAEFVKGEVGEHEEGGLLCVFK